MPSSGKITDRSHEVSCVLVEDQGLFLEMLGGMLAMRGGLRIVGSARSVAEGKAACAKHSPTLLVLDLDLPDGSGLEVAQLLLEINPDARVIIVSGFTSDFVCPDWLAANLQAIISKNDTFASLREELDKILEHASPSGRALDRKIILHKPLTPREAEIFARIGEGLTSKEISALLEISEHTVHHHRKRIAAKLGTSGAELLVRAASHRSTFFAEQDREPAG